MSKFPDYSQRNENAQANTLFVERWSPRAFVKSTIDDAAMLRIMDAARWSPSCFNDQPWRIYTSSSTSFSAFLDCLVDANQAWAKDAAVLGFMVAQKNFSHNAKPNAFAQFDCGAAWMSFTLQARMEGLYTHGMGGIKAEDAANMLKIDTTEQEVVMGFAIGRLADQSTLSSERRDAEVPNQRLALNDIWRSV